MVPDISIHEKLALEHQHTLLCEAEHERRLTEVQPASPDSLQRLAGRLGRYLIMAGTRLQGASAARPALEHRIKSSS